MVSLTKQEMTVSWISSTALRISVCISTKTKTPCLFFFDLGSSLPQVLLQICSYVALLFHFMTLKPTCMCSYSATQSCPTLCDLMDCNPSGFSVHETLQARILEWIAISYLRGSSWPSVYVYSDLKRKYDCWRPYGTTPWIGFCYCCYNVFLTTREKEVPSSWLPKAFR